MPYTKGEGSAKMDKLCTPWQTSDQSCDVPPEGTKGDVSLTTGGFDIPDGQKDSYPSKMPVQTLVDLPDAPKAGTSMAADVDSVLMTNRTLKA